MIVQPGDFNWKCANVLIGVRSSYSSAGADAFMEAAKKNGIDVCAESIYEDSRDIPDAISEIIEERCCLLTVVFAHSEDIVKILVEAHRQLYTGEWLMGETIFDSQQSVTKGLKSSLGDAEAYRLLRGRYELTQS